MWANVFQNMHESKLFSHHLKSTTPKPSFSCVLQPCFKNTCSSCTCYKRFWVSGFRLRACGLTCSGGGGTLPSRTTWITCTMSPPDMARPWRDSQSVNNCPLSPSLSLRFCVTLCVCCCCCPCHVILCCAVL